MQILFISEYAELYIAQVQSFIPRFANNTSFTSAL